MNDPIGILISFQSRHELAMWWSTQSQHLRVTQVNSIFVMEDPSENGDRQEYTIRALGADDEDAQLMRKVESLPCPRVGCDGQLSEVYNETVGRHCTTCGTRVVELEEEQPEQAELEEVPEEPNAAEMA